MRAIKIRNTTTGGYLLNTIEDASFVVMPLSIWNNGQKGLGELTEEEANEGYSAYVCNDNGLNLNYSEIKLESSDHAAIMFYVDEIKNDRDAWMVGKMAQKEGVSPAVALIRKSIIEGYHTAHDSFKEDGSFSVIIRTTAHDGVGIGHPKQYPENQEIIDFIESKYEITPIDCEVGELDLLTDEQRASHMKLKTAEHENPMQAFKQAVERMRGTVGVMKLSDLQKLVEDDDTEEPTCLN